MYIFTSYALYLHLTTKITGISSKRRVLKILCSKNNLPYYISLYVANKSQITYSVQNTIYLTITVYM